MLAYEAKRNASAPEAAEMVGELPAELYEVTSSAHDEYLESARVADNLEDFAEEVRISVAYGEGRMYALFRPKSSPLEPQRIGAERLSKLKEVSTVSNSSWKERTGSRANLTLRQASLEYGQGNTETLC